jgi:hypothetical protein
MKVALYLALALIPAALAVIAAIHVRRTTKSPERRKAMLDKVRDNPKFLKRREKFYSQRSVKAVTIFAATLVMDSLFKVVEIFIAPPDFVRIAEGLLFFIGLIAAIYIYTGPHKVRDEEW